MAECLTTAEIEGLLADILSPEDKKRAEAHLAECENCRREVARLRADDELFGKIKQAYEAETVSRPHDPGDSHPLPGPPTESIEGYEILSEVHRGGQPRSPSSPPPAWPPMVSRRRQPSAIGTPPIYDTPGRFGYRVREPCGPRSAYSARRTHS